MKKTLSLIVIAVALLPLWSQEEKISPARLKLAAEAMELNGTNANIRRTYELTLNRYNELIDKRLSRVVDRKGAKKVADELKQTIRNEFNRDEIQNKSLRVYAAAFTEEELKEIIAFLKSPVGKKYAGSSSEIGEQLSQIFAESGKAVDIKARDILTKAIPPQPPAEAQINPIGNIPGRKGN